MTGVVRAHHGTPITSRDNIVLETLGARDYCVSYHRPDQVQWVNDNARSWIGDNGIFSFWMAALRAAVEAGVPFEGVSFDREYLEGYYGWSRRWCLEGTCSWVVIPDPIGTATQELDALIREWPAELRDYGVPVWHSDEPLERAVRLVDTHGRLCIGAVGEHRDIGSPAYCARMDALWDAFYAAFGAVAPWTHMFRSLKLLEPQWDWPFASHDSAKFARNLHRTKRLGEQRLWAIKQMADRDDQLAANRPTTWVPRHLRQQRLFGDAA